MGRTGLAAQKNTEYAMAGYAIIWIFVLFFALVFLIMTTAYYVLRFFTWLRKYWAGE